MKKEIKKLFASKKGELVINPMFKLVWRTVDYNGNSINPILRIETTLPIAIHRAKEIESRDMQEIIDEVKNDMEEMMADILDEMNRKLDGGLIGMLKIEEE